MVLGSLVQRIGFFGFLQNKCKGITEQKWLKQSVNLCKKSKLLIFFLLFCSILQGVEGQNVTLRYQMPESCKEIYY